MKVVTKQFTKEILLSTGFVLLALVALFAFFDLVGQLDSVGHNRTMGQAILMTILVLPLRIYQVMPLAALLASVYIMSRWAANSEFTVLRVAGMSPVSLTKAILVPGLILVGTTYLFGEFVAPAADRYGLEVKMMARSSNLTAKGFYSGVWLRDVTVNADKQKVDRYINVKYIRADDSRKTGDWRIFQFEHDGRLQEMINAKSAAYLDGKGWMLYDVVRTQYPKWDRHDSAPLREHIQRESSPELLFKSSLGPNILGVLTTRPEYMSMRDLQRYVTHLKKNNQQTEQYEIAFWNKVFYPLAILVMLALSMPFAYMNARSGGMAIKIFIGVLIGIVFYALNNVFSYLGAVNTWPAVAVALTPTATVLLVAAVAMYFVERR